MRNIIFAKAGLQPFLKLLLPLWTKRPAWLIGSGELADGLAAAAAKRQSVVLRRGMPPPHETAPLLIFTETDGAALQAELLACLDLTACTILAPVTDRHFSRHPLFLISIPKSGTHLVYELARALGYHSGVELPEFPSPQTWYCLEYSNSHTGAADFFVDSVRRAPFGNRHHPFMKSPSLFIYRHPLDILVSEAHYYHLDGRSPFAGWFAELDFSGRAERLLDDNFLLGSLRARLGAFLPWLDFPNVISLSFEELVGAAGGGNAAAQLDLIWSILLKLQIPGDPQQIAGRLFNRDAATFRAGQIGTFTHELPSPMLGKFAKSNKDILAAFGYSVTAPGQLPEHRDRFRRRPVKVAAADFDTTPITLETGFMECNLVRYEKRVYAVPLTAGHFDLTGIQRSALDALPSGPDLATVKALLVTGHEDFGRRQHALRRLGDVLRGSALPPEYYAYWTAATGPSVIEAYRDFNIVFFQQRFYGIRRSLGPIELGGDMASLLAQYSMGDLVAAASVAQLRDEIDGLSTAQRLRQHLAVMQVQITALDRSVAAAHQQMTADAEEMKTGLAAVQTSAAARAAGQNVTIDGLVTAYRETAAAALHAQAQAVTLETEIAVLRGGLDRHAADIADVKIAAAARETDAAARTARQNVTIDGLVAAYRETAGAAMHAQEQIVTLETEIAALRGGLDRHAAKAAAAARDHAQDLQRQIATLRETMARSLTAIAESIEKAEAKAAATAAQSAAALASQQDLQRDALERLRGEIMGQLAESANAIHRRLDLQLEELISQRGVLAELSLGATRRLRRWLRWSAQPP
jgi:hypothetical protein